MLQIEVVPYASDALEDAMRLAQTKALNSFTFSDCLSTLNQIWMDIYQRLAQEDEGFYSKTVRLTEQLTKLPPYVKNTVRVYAAQRPLGYDRQIYRASGYNDLEAENTYHVSGFDLYCPDAIRKTVWLNYIPAQPQLFFTHHNRDPKLYESQVTVQNDLFNMYRLRQIPNMMVGTQYILEDRNTVRAENIDITEYIQQEDYEVTYISCDYPYIFVSYRHKVTGDYVSGFYNKVTTSPEWNKYNPFDFSGKPSNVEYVKVGWNDKTGMGVIVKDYNDNGQLKELGWTPDTVLNYPTPEMYRLLVARLADKFAALNESQLMGVQKELIDAEYAFDNFLKKDQGAWKRIDNVNGPNLSDVL
jgi:hypothetical protein